MTVETEAAASTTEAAAGTEANTEAEGKAADLLAEPGNTEGESEGQPTGAPEEYADFTLPEGVTPNAEILTEFKGVAKELGLSQEAAQKLVDFQTAKELAAVEKGATAYTERIEGWKAAVQADKELGGDKMPENLSVAMKAVETFAPPGLKALLASPSKDNPEGLGIGNHPEVIRMFFNIGKAISEDRIAGAASAAAPAKSLAERIFGGNTA